MRVVLTDKNTLLLQVIYFYQIKNKLQSLNSTIAPIPHKFEICGGGWKGKMLKGWQTTNSENKFMFSTASFATQVICLKMFLMLHLEKH